MNTPTKADAAQAAPTPSRGRGRGRGGGPAPRGRSTQKASAPRAPMSKIGPNRLLEAEWVKDSILKGNCFVLFAGSGQTGDQQWTFHHPIGETVLGEREWVATPTRDISFLLQRRESEALTAWKRQSELAKRRQVLLDQKGRKLADDGQTEVWTFDGAPAIQPTIRTCMSAAKAADAKESDWLNFSDQAVRSAEQSFKEALRTQAVPEGWLRHNPKPVHETMGGPLGDQPQKAVPFLEGLSQAAAKDKVIRVAIGLDQAEVPDDEVDDEDDDGVPVKPVTPAPVKVAKPPTPKQTTPVGSQSGSPPKTKS